jgi:uncharacterized protein YjbJ (UPF0337 family)
VPGRVSWLIRFSSLIVVRFVRPLRVCVEKSGRRRKHFCRHIGGEQKVIMNTLEIKGDWNITKAKLKQRWAKLTDNDLQYIEGKQDELLGRIQKRTGETREAVEKAIKESYNCGCANPGSHERPRL